MKKKHEEQPGGQVESVLGEQSLEEFTRDAIEQLTRAHATRFALSIIGEEVEKLCGPAYRRGRHNKRRAGSEPGSIIVDGRREKIKRPRVRDEHGEVRLDSYQALHSYEGLGDFVMQAMLSGISSRGYERSMAEHTEALGVSKSQASREFVSSSREALKEINSRRFPDRTFWALVVDGLHIQGEVVIIALGVDTEGNKHFLGISQGSTENTEVVSSLLASLVDREIQFTKRLLAVTDGAKALRRGLQDHFGKRLAVQRCLIHKKRNVIARLAKPHHREFSERLTQAYNCNDLKTAESELKKVEKWLDTINHNAAESLREGLDDLLTLHRLGMPPELRKSFYTTNLIESAFANPRHGINRVKRWRKDSDMIQRWLGAHLLDQETRFRRVKGFRHIPAFLKDFSLEAAKVVDENAA